MPGPKDRDRRKLIDRVLGEPDLYPDVLKSWVLRFIDGNPLLRMTDFQLPTVEQTSYIGAMDKPVFQNSWVNFGTGYEEAGFYKDSFGRVFLCGTVKSGGAGTTIFTLPAGYRPKNREQFAVSTGTAEQHGRVDITTGGDVMHVSGATAYVQLSGIGVRAYG